MSARNDVVILDEVIEKMRTEVAPSLNIDEYFEVFTAEQIIKHYDLSYEELLDGNVGAGGRDGGVDGMYVFVNGELIQEDTDLSVFRDNIEIRLIITQAKNKTGFEEVVIDKLISISDDILDLSREFAELSRYYNPKLIEIVDRFRRAQKELADRFPKLIISYYYASRGTKPNENMERKSDNLKRRVLSYFPKAEFKFEFLGASKLLDLVRTQPKSTFSLKLAENAIATEGDIGFVCLVKIKDYYDFVADQGNLVRRLFESNVRDFQGNNSVNRQIQSTLTTPVSEDFWWLNNGVTIIASQAEIRGKTLHMQNPEVVNGLQTSFSIHHYFSSNLINEDPRNLLVRVIVPNSPESRERIIRATNSQTPIPEETLRALDKIHRNIEDYLLRFQIYYDRRKNFYKNQRKPLKRIVSIKQMAQAVMSIALHRPDDARGRPNDIIRNTEEYKKVFNVDYPLNLYHFCISLLWLVENTLKDDDKLSTSLEQKARLEVKFHVMMYIVVIMTGTLIPIISKIGTLSIEKVNEDLVISCSNRVLELFVQMGATNRVAKSPEFLSVVISDLESELGSRE